MTDFHYYVGENALSDFRRARLLANIKKIAPSIKGLSAQKIYFVQQDLLSAEQEEKLKELLQTQPQEATDDLIHKISIPRFGTQSAWSSKALDILHRCDLKEIEHIECGIFYTFDMPKEDGNTEALNALLYDSLTELLIASPEEASGLFAHQSAKETQWINILEEGVAALEKINQDLELALTPKEITYLCDYFTGIKRNPSDAELMMFAQANSEHYRHEIFNARWKINGRNNTQSNQLTLLTMIKNTHVLYKANVLSAYTDNAAVIANQQDNLYFAPDANSNVYHHQPGTWDIVIKTETHNHQTAIDPNVGAAAGVGNETRDEAATGRGAKSCAGLSGFSVSNLCIPHFIRPWEKEASIPPRLASSLNIMIEAPVSAAAFNNEYGRPQLMGYFRTFENEIYGYHNPIFIAGGIGQIAHEQIAKKVIMPGAPLIVLGGNTTSLMQRYCQEVINRCFQQGDKNPILSIYDIDSGGLSSALSQLIHQSGVGALIDLRAIPNVESSMTPSEIWSNKFRECYVLALEESGLPLFETLAKRERCPYAIIGHAQEKPVLTMQDSQFNNTPVDLPLSLIFDYAAENIREARFVDHKTFSLLDTSAYDWKETAERILALPSVASKQFLITIADRSVGGLVARDSMVGPWQVPVADVGVIANNFQSYTGSAMAMGERPLPALLNPRASVRLAITEALLNIAAASIEHLSDIKLSTNWMAACGSVEQDSALYEGVLEAGTVFCADLSLCIAEVNDSLSMRTDLEGAEKALSSGLTSGSAILASELPSSESLRPAVKPEDKAFSSLSKNSEIKESISPLSLVVSAFAPVNDVRKTLTPELRLDIPDTRLVLLDLGHKKNRLGASAFAQVYQINTGEPADVDNSEEVKALFTFIQTLNQEQKIFAYHDRSDGGLFSCVCEMAFAAHTGLVVQLENLGDDPKAALFNEEPGVVIQIREEDKDHIFELAKENKLDDCIHIIGRLNEDNRIVFRSKTHVLLAEDRPVWQEKWQETSARIQALRDNPECAKQEWELLLDKTDPGLNSRLSFIPFPPAIPQHLPQIAVLREQGVNGQSEMAAAFDCAGFRAVDVHMSDIIEKRVTLDSFVGLVACGGFSYGDVLGAGRGWASSILHNAYTLNQFQTFFARSDTFALGVGNGCQMLVYLKSIIPGAEHWPLFKRNHSEQFEARLSLVQIEDTPSWFFQRMKGTQLPIVVSHGEGCAFWEDNQAFEKANSLITLRYVNHHGAVTEHYPENPSGSPKGCAGLTSLDGRFNVIMPHPERSFRTSQLSWHPRDWPEYTPWMEVFMSIRRQY
jgi:phosphoribosylformylglycinamidine synthase